VFGVILGIFFAVLLISIVVGLIASGLGSFGRSLVQWAFDTALAPVAALAATVLYFTLRRVQSETSATVGTPAPEASSSAPRSSAPPSPEPLA
jgi:hypothetical protein